YGIHNNVESAPAECAIRRSRVPQHWAAWLLRLAWQRTRMLEQRDRVPAASNNAGPAVDASCNSPGARMATEAKPSADSRQDNRRCGMDTPNVWGLHCSTRACPLANFFFRP